MRAQVGVGPVVDGRNHRQQQDDEAGPEDQCLSDPRTSLAGQPLQSPECGDATHEHARKQTTAITTMNGSKDQC